MHDLSARERSGFSKGDRRVDPFVIYAACGPDRQTVGSDRAVGPSAADAQGQAREAVERPARRAECGALRLPLAPGSQSVRVVRIKTSWRLVSAFATVRKSLGFPDDRRGELRKAVVCQNSIGRHVPGALRVCCPAASSPSSHPLRVTASPVPRGPRSNRRGVSR
jgi:hypothetical protein